MHVICIGCKKLIRIAGDERETCESYEICPKCVERERKEKEEEMLVICASCQKFIRKKEPLDDNRTSHGLCDVCLKKALDEEIDPKGKEGRNARCECDAPCATCPNKSGP